MGNNNVLGRNIVNLNNCGGGRPLQSNKEKILALKSFLDGYYQCPISYSFAAKLFDVLEDVAFCQSNCTWFTFRIIKEISFYTNHYEYESIAQWADYERHLPTLFLTKDEADLFLIEYKTSIFKQMILQASKAIHDIFYQIVEKEVDDLIPANLIRKISIDKLESIEPFIQNIVANQANETLAKNGYGSWKEWEDFVRKDKLINEVKGRLLVCGSAKSD